MELINLKNHVEKTIFQVQIILPLVKLSVRVKPNAQWLLPAFATNLNIELSGLGFYIVMLMSGLSVLNLRIPIVCSTNKYLIIAMTIILLSPPLQADVATSCVSVSNITKYGKEQQQLTNSCHWDIRVAWCHTVGLKAGYTCGSGKNYYIWQTSIKPSESYSNQFSTPINIPIEYKACWGASRSYDNKDGTLSCSAPSIDGLSTESSISCNDSMVNVSIKTIKPGTVLIQGGDNGSKYIYKFENNGKPRELDMKRVVTHFCDLTYPDNIKEPSFINTMRFNLKKLIMTHAKKAEDMCTQKYGKESCANYHKQQSASTGIRD